MPEWQYKILTNKQAHQLEWQVQHHMKSGWEPQGGPLYSSGEEMWAQAMVKKPALNLIEPQVQE